MIQALFYTFSEYPFCRNCQQIQYRLMQQINHQRMPSHPSKRRNIPRPPPASESHPLANPADKISCKEQEIPRQHREIIGRHKSRFGKPQKGHPKPLIQQLRQRQEEYPFYTDHAVTDPSGQPEQQYTPQ